MMHAIIAEQCAPSLGVRSRGRSDDGVQYSVPRLHDAGQKTAGPSNGPARVFDNDGASACSRYRALYRPGRAGPGRAGSGRSGPANYCWAG